MCAAAVWKSQWRLWGSFAGQCSLVASSVLQACRRLLRRRFWELKVSNLDALCISLPHWLIGLSVFPDIHPHTRGVVHQWGRRLVPCAGVRLFYFESQWDLALSRLFGPSLRSSSLPWLRPPRITRLSVQFVIPPRASEDCGSGSSYLRCRQRQDRPLSRRSSGARTCAPLSFR